MKKNVLFLCTGNSCRSQMAEAWGQNLKGDQFSFYSAGTKKHGLNPNAVKVMQEVGIDMSAHESKLSAELPDIQMDYVFTVCDNARESCPYFPGGKIIHVGFDDPPSLTRVMRDTEATLSVYQRVRDEIKEMILNIETYIVDSN